MTRHTVALSAAALWLLSPAWADVTATVTLRQGQTLDLDTGALGTGSEADLVYSGLNGVLSPLPFTGLTVIGAAYSQVTQADLLAVTTYAVLPIADVALSPGRVLAARTKTGKFSKLIVANNVSGTLVITFNTFTANPFAPIISSVQNNYGQIPAGLPNSALAPGSLIFVTGTNLSTINDGQTLRSSVAPGLQNTIGGVSVTVTVNGISLNCPLYYLSPRQINAVLPGNTPIGTGTIFVTNEQGRSSSFGVRIAQSSFGIVHYNGTLAATYDANNALITRFNAANPRQTIVIWGSGVGADAGNDDRLFPQQTNNLVNVPMQVLVGGRPATILYRGRSQFPGVDQVVATLPSDAPTGCYVPLSVITGNIVSNGVTIPFAATGRTCADAEDPLTPALIRTLSAKPTVNLGTLSVTRQLSSEKGTSVEVLATFQSRTDFGLRVGNRSVSMGHCVTSIGYEAYQFGSRLDAGPTFTVRTPQGNIILNRSMIGDSTDYRATSLAQTFVPTTGGDFGYENFSGGADVGRISTILTLPANFTWTNPAALAIIDRQGATLTWTGGSGADYVEITGSSLPSSSVLVNFHCRAPISASRFTIPAYALMALPSGAGLLEITAISQKAYAPGGLDFLNQVGLAGFINGARY